VCEMFGARMWSMACEWRVPDVRNMGIHGIGHEGPGYDKYDLGGSVKRDAERSR